MSDIELSVIIPAYNEAGRIEKTLREAAAYLNTRGYGYEIIVVDDGSADATAQVAAESLRGMRYEIITFASNQGKGAAVREGMLRARGRYLLFCDADMSTPIEEVDGFIRRLEQGADLVIGSRALKDSKVEVRQPFFREFIGRIFNLIAKWVAFHTVRDSQCGFKCFKQAVARRLFSAQRLNGFSFDAEIVYLAQKYRYRLIEAPVTWRNHPMTRVNVVSDPWRMLADLIRIRWLHRKDS